MLKFFKVNEKGFTAVELIIALAVSLLVVAAAGFILLTQSGVIRLNNSVSTEQQRLNTAFNTVRSSLRMAGFDYGQGFLPSPVKVVQTNPYEVFVSYGSIVNGSNPCLLTAVSGTTTGTTTETTGEFSGDCPNFYKGQILIINPTPPTMSTSQETSQSCNTVSPMPGSPCITKVMMVNMSQTNSSGGIEGKMEMGGMDAGPNVCSANPVPSNSIGGSSVSSIKQVLFYWGNTAYNFNAPFDVPGKLYECKVNPVTLGCAHNTTITLSGYINNFTVTPIPQSSLSGDLYDVSITGESNVALSDSPAYSVRTVYNSNTAGVSPAGANILKTLNSNVFLRNVSYYGG